MTLHKKIRATVLLFSGAIAAQAVLSASSLAVGLVLVRRASDEDYGYYVLTLTAILLTTALQAAYIQPQLVTRLAAADARGRADLTGGLYREQRRLWPVFSLVMICLALVLWSTGHINQRAMYVACAASVAVVTSMFREFFRMMLLAHRRSVVVLAGDCVYSVILICSATLATFTRTPALLSVTGLIGAALVSGLMFTTAMWRFEPWNIHGAKGILSEMAPMGYWTTAGSATHWVFSQGFNFLVAGSLGVISVAAIAATRILIMPVNLLSTGICALMFPTVAGWLQKHSATVVFRRNLAVIGGLVCSALFYFLVIWIIRDWLFSHVLKKQVPNRDELLIFWFSIAILMLARDQLLYLLLSKSRFKVLTALSIAAAVVSLTISAVVMPLVGAIGALMGVLCGEIVNVTGMVVLSLQETRRDRESARLKQVPG